MYFRSSPKLLRYFNCTIILTYFMPLVPVWPGFFYLILNKSVVALAALNSLIALVVETGSSLQYCNI